MAKKQDNPKKNKHLTPEDRKEIEECLGKQMTFKLTKGADGIRRGTAVLSIRMVKDQEELENYIVTATGNSTYLLVKADNDTLRYHATIIDEGIPGKGRQMLLSGYGKTERYE